ncbi:uncharacterized protein Tco025E_09952 [Trypanosoma conorhini]|uniref:Uncharacterized protein n=1 Tax=Trypanosoma conorhini TaxID=83891 RepID=A0A3R7LEE2_9TRYP|nr:uncharacterized protein Tco025E_09952 [Trypanosoma conorhini]RNE95667.1 hypothetical protein Tco025E_09952 [Trypanosoma conorhini]
MFLSAKMLFSMVLIACVVSFLCADLSRLPTQESAMLEISRLLHKTEDCSICGEVLRGLDAFQLSRSISLIRATQGYDKPHSAFVRACEENPNTLGCDTALDRDRAERTKRASMIMLEMGQLPESKEQGVSDLLSRRYDDFVTYLINEREQERCLTCVVEAGRVPRLVASPLADVFLDCTWYHIYPINERHQAFCWRHCEGLLTYLERVYLWLLRFYVTRSVRFHLMALQSEHFTIALILGQLALLVVILQRYVTDVKGGGGGGSHFGGNLHTDNTATAGQRGASRRTTLGRGKGGGRRD